MLLIDLAASLAGYLLLGVACFGWGRVSARLLRIDLSVTDDLFLFVWLGWAAMLFVLELVQIVVPIQWIVSLVMLLVGVAYAIWLRRDDRTAWTECIRPKWAFVTVALGAAIWIAGVSTVTPGHYDSGLYYFNAIRWLNERPVVLGLANLHDRLAFNQTLFLYVGLLNVYPWFGHGYAVANSFLWLTTFLGCLTPLLGWRTASVARLVPVLFLPVLIDVALGGSLSSPASDTTVALLEIVLFCLFVLEIDRRLSGGGSDRWAALLLVLSATAVTIKMSSLGYVAGLCAAVLLIRAGPQVLRGRAMRRRWSRLIPPVLILGLWMGRGVLLSGCPLFPSTIGCLDVPWAAPIERVRTTANWVYSWARLPDLDSARVLSSWAWLHPWLADLLHGYELRQIVYPLLVAGVGVLITAGLLVRRRRRRGVGAIVAAPIPVLLGLTYWFALAPAPRFAGALFWILPVSTAFVIASFLAASRKLTMAVLVVAFVAVNGSCFWTFVPHPRSLVVASRTGYGAIPVAPLTPRTTASGLTVLTPARGEQCWDSPLPCTPEFDPQLQFVDRKMFPEFTLTSSARSLR